MIGKDVDQGGEECRRFIEHVLNLTRLELMRRRRDDSRELPTLPHFTAVAQYETSRGLRLY